ncbi:ribosome biogenesis GTPase Der [Rickettsiales bacterium]|nr:ribosome biogenesis GTPase Der [Rickettsiales bacterium]
MSFTVAIIGRPNVGKSTLFNRLTGRKHAIVDSTPGVTRDRREGKGNIASLEFNVIDTPGLEESDKNALEYRMMMQTEAAIDQSDVCFMVIDGRLGVTPVDKFFARWLRKKGKDVITVVNKCEGSHGDAGYIEAIRLGFSHTVQISAEHNEGMGELYDVLAPCEEKYRIDADDLDIENEDNKAIQIAIVGRPNVGKSTLMNQLLGEDRVLTGPEAGITRDSIAIEKELFGNKIRLIDTAGIRRKSNVTGELEKMSVGDSFRALQFAHVAVLMLDATCSFEKQDLIIADRIIKEGRAVIVALNKWDLVKDKKKFIDDINFKIDECLPDIKGVKIVTLSALNGVRTDEIIKQSIKAYETWNMRISTAKLNQWLKDKESAHLPPLGKNKRRVKLKYLTQGNTRPPTFTLFSNLPADLPESYRRYLINAMREDFKLNGVPMRLMLRKSDNPYENKRKKK